MALPAGLSYRELQAPWAPADTARDAGCVTLAIFRFPHGRMPVLNTGSLTVIGRLGAMFERTASVRTDEDLQHVLWQVAHTIGETLGYRAVVVNIYRPAFDDMFTAAAVGSDESVAGAARPDHAARDLDAAVRASLRASRRLLRPAGRASTGTRSPAAPTSPEIEPTDDPDAWQADDALFVPLRGAGGKLLGVVSVDEPETGRRPERCRLDALVASSRHAALAIRIAQDVASAAQHQRMLEHVLEVSARLAQAGDVPALLQSVCDGICDALAFDKVVIELADESGSLVPVGGRRLDGGCAGREPGNEHRLLRAALHPGVRDGRLLPGAARSRRGAARPQERGLRVRAERPRAAGVEPPLAARAAVGAGRHAASG